jgi:ketosteroid isomerase-like protein
MRENEAIVRNLLSHWLQKEALDLLAEDLQYTIEADDRSFPFAGTYSKEDLARIFVRSRATQVDHHIELHSVTVDDSRVVVEERMTATVSGQPILSRSCAIFEIRDGQVMRIRKYLDTAHALRFRNRELEETLGAPSR